MIKVHVNAKQTPDSNIESPVFTEGPHTHTHTHTHTYTQTETETETETERDTQRERHFP